MLKVQVALKQKSYFAILNVKNVKPLGYRYELYCASKSYKTTHCVIHCDVSPEEAWSWNESRSDEKYSKDVFDGLVARYETPNGSNRYFP
jgi:tRNA uridine 5-carbamoylmethylation protein Kti12